MMKLRVACWKNHEKNAAFRLNLLFFLVFSKNKAITWFNSDAIRSLWKNFYWITSQGTWMMRIFLKVKKDFLLSFSSWWKTQHDEMMNLTSVFMINMISITSWSHRLSYLFKPFESLLFEMLIMLFRIQYKNYWKDSQSKNFSNLCFHKIHTCFNLILTWLNFSMTTLWICTSLLI